MSFETEQLMYFSTFLYIGAVLCSLYMGPRIFHLYVVQFDFVLFVTPFIALCSSAL